MEESDMLSIDIANGFKDTLGRPSAAERLHESWMAHQTRESREELDVFRLLAGRGQQEEENPTRLTLRRSEPDGVRRNGHEQDRRIHTAHRGATVINSEGMGRLLSHDIPIFAGLQTLVSRSRPQNRTIFSIIAAEQVGRHESLKISVVGAPVAESLMGTHILADLGVPEAWLGGRLPDTGQSEPVRIPRTFHELQRWIAQWIGLVPVALAVMFLTFLVAFRSLTAALLPLSEVGACLIFVFAFTAVAWTPQ